MLLDRDGILRKLALANAAALQERDALAGLGQPDLQAYRSHVYRYVQAKLLLDDEPQDEERRLAILCQRSVEKAGRLNPNETVLLDVSRHCGATTSAMTKKVLLLMAVGKDFGVDMTRFNTADIETTDDLAYLLYRER